MNRVFREEKKFLISLPEALQISSRLSQVMLEDAHNGIHGYRIRSLYFDTIDDTDYIQNYFLHHKEVFNYPYQKCADSILYPED